MTGRRRPASGATLTATLTAAVALALLGAAPAAAQDAATVVSASGYGNFHAGGVLLTVSGDANGNATAALE